MVEFAQSTQVCKGGFIVTFLAVRAQIIVVLILVATAAIFEGHSGKTLEGLPVFGLFQVAINAGHRFVFA